ncbi:hypothetical protein C1T17_05150 [Sphingobium sp. SCG-1]|nr:hypothetical protein C1T17_05150 [Sphingobium sp. SCG-1]
MAQIGGNMQRTRASILASAATVKRNVWRGAYDRAKELAAIHYNWKSVRLISATIGRTTIPLMSTSSHHSRAKRIGSGFSDLSRYSCNAAATPWWEISRPSSISATTGETIVA